MKSNNVISFNIHKDKTNNLLYTTSSVYENWVLLNNTNDDIQRKLSHLFLLNFVHQDNIANICLELTTLYDEATQLFASSSLFNHINDKILKISESKETFNKYKTLLLNQFLPKLKLTSNIQEKISMNICSAITILLLMGKITHWSKSIEDVIELSKVSKEYNIFSSMILSNIHYALSKMKVSERDIQEIKDSLCYSFEIVNKYILSLYTNVKNSQGNFLFKNLINISFSFANIGDNILIIEDIINFFLTSMPNYDNSTQQLISECLITVIKKTKSAKIYNKIKLDEKNINNNYTTILISYCDQNELSIIINLINMIYNLFLNFSSVQNILAITPKEKEILFHTANVYSSICKYYIYLMFNLDELSSHIIEIFSFFMKCPILKISILFFDVVEEMKLFVDIYFKLSSYNENQKYTFMNFIFTLSDYVMNNTKLQNLNVNYNNLEKNKYSTNLSNLTLFSILDDVTDDNSTLENNDMSLQTYRQNAKEVYYDLFIIIKYMFNHYGIEQYLTRLGEMLMNTSRNINSIEQVSNEYLTLVEAVLFHVDSIHEVFDLPDMNPEMLFNFCKFILNSQLMQNDKIMLSFTSFLYSLHPKIHQDKILYEGSIKFLLQESNNDLLQGIATTIIKLIIENADKEIINDNVYEILYHYLINNYNKLFYISAGNIVEAFLRSKMHVNIKLNDICITIKNLKDIIMDDYSSKVNNIQEKYKSTQKIVEVLIRINKIISNINDEMLNLIYCKEYSNDNMNFIFNLSNIIIDSFYNDAILMNMLVTLFIYFANGIKSKSENYFDEINSLIFILYSKNNSIFYVIQLMKIFYEQILLKTNNIKRKNSIADNFFIICNQIKRNCISLTNRNDIFIETMTYFALFINSMMRNLPYINMNSDNNSSNLFEIISILIESNRTIIHSGMNNNIIKAISSIYKSKLLSKDIKDKITSDIVLVQTNWIYSNININNNAFSLMLIDIYNVNKELFCKIIKNCFQFGNIISDYFIVYEFIGDFVEKINFFVKELVNICKEGTTKDKEMFVKKYQIKIDKIKNIINKYKGTI